jgi:hypothetical protein
MTLIKDGSNWRIEGEGKESARIAYAHLVSGRLKYSFDPAVAVRVNGDQAASGPVEQLSVRSELRTTSNSLNSSTSEVV